MVHSAWGRGKIDLPPGIAKKLGDTHVFVGNDVGESRYRRDLPRSMRVERISDEARNREFKVRDERQREQQAVTGRSEDTGRVNGEANKDNKDARKLEQQQRKDMRDQEKAARTQTHVEDKAQRKASKAQGERVGKPAKSEGKPQTMGAPKERKPPAAQPGNQGKGGGGKGKGKKP